MKPLEYKYEESGGYDCVTPAFVVYQDGVQKFVIDLKDFGCNRNSRNSMIDKEKERHEASRRAYDMVGRLCLAYNEKYAYKDEDNP